MHARFWSKLPFGNPFLAFALGLVFQLAFVALYLGLENGLPFWDYAMYADMAKGLFEQPSPQAAWALFQDSFAQKYNLLFALPAQLSFSLFGAGRFVFILTQAAFVFTAYQAAAAFVLARSFQKPFASLFAGVFALTCLIPFIWFPLLEGYPDHGAAAALLAAFGLLIGKERGAKSFFVAGLLIALAVLLRRPYAYAGLALLAASGLCDLRSLGFWRSVRLYALCGAAALGVLALCEPAYLREMIQTDYLALYKSYDRGAGYFSLFVLARCGLDLVLIALGGWVLLFRRRPVSLRPFILALLWCAFWFCGWAFGPAQAADHYLIAVLPLFFYIGLAALAFGLEKGRLKNALFIYLALRSLLLLLALPQGPLPSDAPSLNPFYAARPPVRDPDQKDLIALGQKILLTTTAPTDRILVVGSSFLLNQDKIRVLLADTLQSPQTAQKILTAPEIDGPAQTPADVFASATLYVVPRLPQYHLEPESQRVVTALWKALTTLREESFFFERLADRYKLGDQTVELWRRKSWTPEKLLRGLYLIGEEVRYMRPWVVTQMGGGTTLVQGLNAAGVEAQIGSVDNKSASLFMMHPLETGRYRIEALLEKKGDCGTVFVRTRIEEASGQTIYQETFAAAQEAAQLAAPFAIKNEAQGFLSLDLWAETKETCRIRLEGLNVVRLP